MVGKVPFRGTQRVNGGDVGRQVARWREWIGTVDGSEIVEVGIC